MLATWWSIIPYLRWRTTTITLTNFRLITRTGILNKTGANVPLARVNDVRFERSLSRSDARLRHTAGAVGR